MLASSVMVSVAVRLPAADGVNVTDTVHDAPTGRETGLEGHVFVCVKSAAFAPVGATLPIDKGAVPEFVTVTDFTALVDPRS